MGPSPGVRQHARRLTPQVPNVTNFLAILGKPPNMSEREKLTALNESCTFVLRPHISVSMPAVLA